MSGANFRKNYSRNPIVILHRFPRDTQMREIWKQQCGSTKNIKFDSGFYLIYKFITATNLFYLKISCCLFTAFQYGSI